MKEKEPKPISTVIAPPKKTPQEFSFKRFKVLRMRRDNTVDVGKYDQCSCTGAANCD